eukprot:scaffold83907_cov15-Prasinocladus_malaysianus.AAC.1
MGLEHEKCLNKIKRNSGIERYNRVELYDSNLRWNLSLAQTGASIGLSLPVACWRPFSVPARTPPASSADQSLTTASRLSWRLQLVAEPVIRGYQVYGHVVWCLGSGLVLNITKNI